MHILSMVDGWSYLWGPLGFSRHVLPTCRRMPERLRKLVLLEVELNIRRHVWGRTWPKELGGISTLPPSHERAHGSDP